MAKESNPFSNFLESWGTDPEAQAKGQVYSATAQLKSGEAERMSDILAARRRFAVNPNISPTVRDIALARENMDAENAMTGEGLYRANALLSNVDAAGNVTKQPNLNTNDYRVANMLRGKGDSGNGMKIENVNGFPFAITDNGISPLFKNVEKIIPPSVVGGQNIKVTSSLDENGNVVQNAVQAPTPGAFTISSGDYQAAAKARQASYLTRNRAAIDYADGPYSYAINKTIGAIDSAGNPTGIPPLNPLETEAITTLAKQYEGAGYMPDEAIRAALMRFKSINQQGGVVTKDFDNRGVFDNFLGLGGGAGSNEYDAAGNELPQLGKNAKYSASKDLNIKKLPGLQPGEAIVPFMTQLASQSDQGNIATMLAGAAVSPDTASLQPTDPNSLLIEGKFYHDGSGKFFRAQPDENGKIVLKQITGKNQ